MTRRPATNPSIGSVACPWCERINPPDAKFCNACGTPIHLVSCAHCGAVNDPLASNCHQCAAVLLEKKPGGLARSWPTDGAPEAAEAGARTAAGKTQPVARPPLGADEFDRDATFATLQQLRGLLGHADPEASAGGVPASATGRPDVADTVPRRTIAARAWLPARASAEFTAIRVGSRMVPRRHLAVIAGAIVFVVLAAAGYYAYVVRPVLDVHVPAARGTVKDSGSRAATGALVNPSGSAGGGAPSAPIPAPAGAFPVAADAQPGVPAPEGSAAAVRSGPGAQATDPSKVATPASARDARPRSADAAPGIIERQPLRVGPCTEGVAALGLCAPESVQRRE